MTWTPDRADARHRVRPELFVCLAIATAIVALQSYVPLRYEQYFDSDQAVYGLMAKHLSEGRAFPLFFYGQNYMLGVQSWLAVPFMWIGGPTYAMLRAPVVLMNLAVALGYVWMLASLGLRPRYALAAALPVVAITPVKAMEFGAVYGAGIEPFGYVLLLWLLRNRPLAFGALLGFGTLHREFTFLALPALAIASLGDGMFWRWKSLAGRAAGFGATWIVVDIIKRHVNRFGPSGGDWSAGSVTLGAQTFAQWLSFDIRQDWLRIWELLKRGIPYILGARPYSLEQFSFPSSLTAGSVWAGLALAAALALALLGLATHTRRPRPVTSDEQPRSATSLLARRFFVYLAACALFNIAIYGLNGGFEPSDTPPLRYALLAPLLVIAVTGAFFAVASPGPLRVAAALLLCAWAAGSVVDNVRLVSAFARHPPPAPRRVLTDYLVSHGIKYARAIYWDAYVVTFYSRERVIVASMDTVRISAYQAEVERHASEAVTLQRMPCTTGPQVAAWCIVPPAPR